jgi:hypothetical protein
MDFKEYLLTQSKFNLAKLAFLMWPDNQTAPHYLSKKLHGHAKRKFTAKDEALARTALKQLGHELIADAKQKP